MKDIIKYLRHYIKESILAPLFKMLEASFELFVPLVMAASKTRTSPTFLKWEWFLSDWRL